MLDAFNAPRKLARQTRSLDAVPCVVAAQPPCSKENKQKYGEQTVLSIDFAIGFPLAPAAASVEALFASAGVRTRSCQREMVKTFFSSIELSATIWAMIGG